MIIEISKLELDKENPRFQTSFGIATDEKEIYEYLRDFEKLEEIKGSILRAGFYQIGERVVVTKTSLDSYRVLEGNRRVCALKDIHGFYGNVMSDNEDLIRKTQSIEVDIITDEDDIQPFLSIRHIDGVRKWGPESRRKFYYRHFENNKTIDEIKQMTQQPISEIKKFVKEQFFLNFFKSIINVNKIKSPSLIYERIYRYSVELKLIDEIEISELSKNGNTRIKQNLHILNQEEQTDFFKEIYRLTFNDNKDLNIINSRSINKISDYKYLLSSSEVKNRSPKLFDLMNKLMHINSIIQFIPIQKYFEAIKGNIPPLKDIIEYALIADTAIVKIIHQDNEITQEEFKNGAPGNYFIDINSQKFPFRIKPYTQPQIIAPNTVSFTIGNGYLLINEIQIYNHKELKVGINDKCVSIVWSSELSFNGDELRASSAGLYMVEVKYEFNENSQTYIDRKVINIEVEALKPEKLILKQLDIFFDFKIIDFSKATSYMTNAKLFDELEHAYKEKHHHIFIAALRSLLDLYIIEFHERSKLKSNGNIWSSCAKESDVREKFKQMDIAEIPKICTKFRNVMKTTRSKNFNEHTLKNYFEANITKSSITQLMATLHLGAHTSLRNLTTANISMIRPIITAWIEFLFVLEEIDFIW